MTTTVFAPLASAPIASPDTWGIPSRTFAVAYLLLAILAVIIVFARRRSTSKDTSAASDLTPSAAGMLISPQRAVLAAVSELRAAGLISSTGYPTRALTAHDVANHSSFVRSVLERMPVGAAARRDDLRPPLHQLKAGLIARGLMAPHSRAGVGVLLPMIILGIARIGAGITNGKPVGYLTVVVAALVIVAAYCVARPSRLTPKGRAALKALCAEHALLDPHWRPAMGSVGARRAGLATAVFGVGALTLLDPQLAAAQAVFPSAEGVGRSYGAGSVFGGSSCSSGSSGVGSSCGGGGGGGGSSCGGGGGCGG